MRAFFLGVILMASACGAPAPTHGVALEVRDAWAPPTPGGVDVSAGYLTIVNGTNEDERLLAASSPRAERVDLHDMTMNGAVMRMRKVEVLTIPAHGEIALAPSVRHLMFFGVSQPFAEGEQIPVTLTFARAGEVNAVLTVQRGGRHAH